MVRLSDPDNQVGARSAEAASRDQAASDGLPCAADDNASFDGILAHRI
jgi:hypothetical protein